MIYLQHVRDISVILIGMSNLILFKYIVYGQCVYGRDTKKKFNKFFVPLIRMQESYINMT